MKIRFAPRAIFEELFELRNDVICFILFTKENKNKNK